MNDAGTSGGKPTTVTLDVEIIEQWLDWLDNICVGESDDLLRADLKEVLAHPERCQPYQQGRGGGDA